MSTTSVLPNLEQELAQRYEHHQAMLQQWITFLVARGQKILEAEETVYEQEVSMLGKPKRVVSGLQMGAGRLFEIAMRLSRGQLQATMLMAKHEEERKRRANSPPEGGLALPEATSAPRTVKAIELYVAKQIQKATCDESKTEASPSDVDNERDSDPWRAPRSSGEVLERTGEPSGLAQPQPGHSMSRRDRKRRGKELRRKLVSG